MDMSLHYSCRSSRSASSASAWMRTYLSQYDQHTAPGTRGQYRVPRCGPLPALRLAHRRRPVRVRRLCLFPRWRAQGSLNWQLGDWSASWRMRYIGSFRMGSTQLAGRVPGWPVLLRRPNGSRHDDAPSICSYKVRRHGLQRHPVRLQLRAAQHASRLRRQQRCSTSSRRCCTRTTRSTPTPIRVTST